MTDSVFDAVVRAIKQRVRDAGLDREVAIVAIAHDGYPVKAFSVIVQRLSSAQPDLEDRLRSALGDVPFRFQELPGR